MADEQDTIKVTYRRTSRMAIRIGKNGEVRVSAPIGMPRQTVIDFINKNIDWINKAIDKTYERQRQRHDFFNQLPLSTKEECKQAAERMNKIIPPLVERYSKQMGVRPSGLRYSATTSKWGSCNVRTHRIQFSAYLLLLPDWCIEHVVVHELAHLIEANHGPRFYQIMDKYFPRWHEARQETARLSRMEIEE